MSDPGTADVVVIVDRSTVVSAVADGFAVGDSHYEDLADALAATALGAGDPVAVEIPETSPVSVESFVELVASLPVERSRQQSDFDEASLTVNGRRFHAIGLHSLGRGGIAPASVSRADDPWRFVSEDDIGGTLGWVSSAEGGAMISGAWHSNVRLHVSGHVVIEDREADSSERYLFIVAGRYSRVAAVQEWFEWLDPHVVGVIETICGSSDEPTDDAEDNEWSTDTLGFEAHLDLTDDEQRQLWEA